MRDPSNQTEGRTGCRNLRRRAYSDTVGDRKWRVRVLQKGPKRKAEVNESLEASDPPPGTSDSKLSTRY